MLRRVNVLDVGSGVSYREEQKGPQVHVESPLQLACCDDCEPAEERVEQIQTPADQVVVEHRVINGLLEKLRPWAPERG